MKSNKFNSKICLITGASSGIGEALARLLNEMGAFLILTARNHDKLEQVKSSCSNPDNIKILPWDIEKTETLANFAQKSWSLFQGIDFIFLNAGMAVRDLILDTDLEMVYKVMNINFFSNVALSRAFLPFMRENKNGCFVVTSSLCGKFGIPKLGAYSASKHALHGFFESLRAEYEQDGIKVTMITAGLVKTNITVHALRGNGAVSGKMQPSVAGGIAPEVCANRIIKAVRAGKHEALVGAFEKYSVLLKRFFPGLLRMAITKHPMKKLRAVGLLPSPAYGNRVVIN
jgi:dehydrogenase/reductase SDR family member 7B